MTDPTGPPQDARDGSRQEAFRKEQLDDWLDRALEATFPASDPPSSIPDPDARPKPPDRNRRR